MSSIAAVGLTLFLALPSGRHHQESFTDGKASATTFDDDGWKGIDSSLPFIRYSKKGWVLSDPLTYEAVTTCQIDDRRFRCLAKEKEAHGSELQDIARELNLLPR